MQRRPATTLLALALLQLARPAAALLPVLPLSTRPASGAPWAQGGSAACRGGFCGDVRARLAVSAGDIVAGQATAQIFWRRRDPTPWNKSVLVTDAAGNGVAVASADVEATCGVVTFAAAAAGEYFAYYLPFAQGDGGAWTTFSWTGCNDTAYDESNPCVLGRRRRLLAAAAGGAAASVCAAATPAAALAVALENRDDFNAFTDMEMMASAQEAADAAAALAARPGGAPFVGVFPEDRSRAVRVFDAGAGIPVRWCPGGGGPSGAYSAAGPAFAGTAAPGEFYTFQLALWGFAGAVSNITAAASSLSGAGGTIDAAAVVMINLQGVDVTGAAYNNSAMSVPANGAASLWVAVQVPSGAAPGAYAGTISVSTAQGAPAVSVAVTITVAGAPVEDGGAGDLYSFSRLSWLYSTRGLEDTVPAPFVKVSAEGGGGTGLPLVLGALLKRVAVGEDGLFSGIEVSMPRRAAGFCEPGHVRPGAFGPATPGFLVDGDDVLPPGPAASLADAQALCARTPRCTGITFASNSSSPEGAIPNVYYKGTFDEVDSAGWFSFAFCRATKGEVANTLLAAPVRFELFNAAGALLPASPTAIATVASRSDSSVSWTAQSTAAWGGLVIDVAASLDFTSYAEFAVTVSNGGAAAFTFGDVRLTLPVAPAMCGYMVGMDNGGAPAQEYADREWRWTNSTGANKLWLGRTEGGVLLNLKGEGIKWDSPMFGEDYPVIPFVPPTWGGADARPTDNAFGVNVTSCTAVAFSGPRTLAPGQSVVFRFDLAITPSKLSNYTRHFATRAFQVGYGTDYYTPQQMADMGVTAVTLHQGTPGIINASMVNPWINYPFLNDTVPLLANYSQQANDLGLLVRYYYTVRELSSRAWEIFAFKAQQGEVLVEQDPYVIVQPGYAHAWNTHGGSAWLHQHAGSSYAACWQQTESDGEWDPSMCSIGVSRLFNYYVEGLYYGMSHAPNMNGNYYDGTNFPRSAMIRIRRAADAGAAARGLGLPALLDLHTGREGTPDACSYASHYPLVDSIWNGEGFDFSAAPAYWLVEIASRVHGLTGDMLGAGVDAAFRGALFGMTTRNSNEAPAWWRAWDETNIAAAAADAVFSTLDLLPSPVAVVNGSSCGGGPTPNPGSCNWTHTANAYYDGAPCGQAAGNELCFGDGTPTGRLTLAQAQAQCCNDTICAGFSFSPGASSGCFKRSNSCLVNAGGVDGYQKPGFVPAPAPGGAGATHATVFSAFASHAIVAVATWCPAGQHATLQIDYEALGLDPARLNVTAPAIAGVQAAASFPSAEGPFALTGGGIFLLLQATS